MAACVCITGTMRTCPTRVLEIITNITPIHLVIGRVDYYLLLQVMRESGVKVWSSLNNNISSANLIKKVSVEQNLSTIPCRRKKWKWEYTDYYLRDATDSSKIATEAGDWIYYLYYP